MAKPVVMVGEGMVGDSPRMRELKTHIANVARSDSNVLVIGETGTGKELAAEMIHRHSARKAKPFVCINCAAIPDNLFESELFGYEKGAFSGALYSYEGKLKLADGGTVLLDEIGDMTAFGQAKLLRVVENREVHPLGGKKAVPLDIRIIAATNRDLEHLAEEYKFRMDLFYRLEVLKVQLPPLRARKEDIPQLVDHFVRELNRRFGCNVEGVDSDARDFLLRYDWPGNIRELKNVLEAVFVSVPNGPILQEDLPEPFRRRVIGAELHSRDERDRLLAALFATDWNKSKAAQKLHWSRMTIYRKMAKHRIEARRKWRSAVDDQVKATTMERL